MGWGGVRSVGVGGKVEKNLIGVCFGLFWSLLLKIWIFKCGGLRSKGVGSKIEKNFVVG